jgi:hypothetical protein
MLLAQQIIPPLPPGLLVSRILRHFRSDQGHPRGQNFLAWLGPEVLSARCEIFKSMGPSPCGALTALSLATPWRCVAIAACNGIDFNVAAQLPDPVE